MTQNSVRLTSPPMAGIHQPKIFGPVVAVTVLVALVGSGGQQTGASGSLSVWSILVLFFVIAVFGIPHGAVDHLVAARTQAARGAVISTLGFNVRYLGAMVVYGVVWLAVPGLALGIFLLLAVHHFGQSDLAYLRLSPVSQMAVQWSRGVFVIGAPLIAHVAAISPVISNLGGGEPAAWSWLADNGGMWFLFVIGQHLLIGGAVALRAAHPATVRREALGLAVLAVLFWRTDPLLGFAVYFGLWHSVAHLLVVMDALGPRTASQQALRVREFVRIAAPRSLISVVATIVFAGVAVMNGRSELLLPAVFVMVSLLTLPHMVVVEQLWRGTIGKSPLVR